MLTIRRRLCEALSQHRGRAVAESVPSGQTFALDLEHALLEEMDDPDKRLPLTLSTGTPLGVEEVLDYCPDVWPPKRHRDMDLYAPRL